MKKIISFFLVAILCISLCSCGKNIEKLKEDAISIELEDLFNEYFENEAAAEIKYKNQPLKFTARVSSIHSYGLDIWASTSVKSGLITVKMDKDDLAKLSKNKTYTFIAYYDGSLFYDAVVVE